jgi:hypothetical protein
MSLGLVHSDPVSLSHRTHQTQATHPTPPTRPHLQVGRAHEPQVRRHLVPRLDEDDVAGDELVGRDDGGLAVAADLCD